MTSSKTDTPTATLTMVNIDCDDAGAMARFWSQLLGGTIEHDEGDYSMVNAGGVSLGFGRTDDYARPTWPDTGHKQFHLDLSVADLDAAMALATGLGATKADPQPDDADGKWVVLVDPCGHPFCLVPSS